MSKNLPLNIEQIKKDKDGLDVLSDIFIYAVLGERVSEADLIRFQWYGIHAQGRDDKGDYFKLKIPLSLGELNLEQIKALSKISKEYAKDSLDFTKSQKIEFSWLRIYDLPAVFNILQAVELNTTFESGHNVRNIILNCVNKEHLTDISDVTNKLNETFRGNKNFSNLPNKLQIAISGCARKAVENNTHDVNFDAVKNDKDKNKDKNVKLYDFDSTMEYYEKRDENFIVGIIDKKTSSAEGTKDVFKISISNKLLDSIDMFLLRKLKVKFLAFTVVKILNKK